MSYDTQMANKQKVFNVSKVEFKGGGGTSMDEAINEVAAMKPRFDLIILITDGETAWPKKPILNPRVITVLVRKPYGEEAIPKWIRAIRAYEK
jgi:predicted metal-dependent peptidase